MAGFHALGGLAGLGQRANGVDHGSHPSPVHSGKELAEVLPAAEGRSHDGVLIPVQLPEVRQGLGACSDATEDQPPAAAKEKPFDPLTDYIQDDRPAKKARKAPQIRAKAPGKGGKPTGGDQTYKRPTKKKPFKKGPAKGHGKGPKKPQAE